MSENFSDSFSCKTRKSPFQIVSIMAADGLTNRGARTSAGYGRVNSLSRGRCSTCDNFKSVISEYMYISTSCAMLSAEHIDDLSTLVQIMAWCLTAPSPYLSQCWPRFVAPLGQNELTVPVISVQGNVSHRIILSPKWELLFNKMASLYQIWHGIHMILYIIHIIWYIISFLRYYYTYRSILRHLSVFLRKMLWSTEQSFNLVHKVCAAVSIEFYKPFKEPLHQLKAGKIVQMWLIVINYTVPLNLIDSLKCLFWSDTIRGNPEMYLKNVILEWLWSSFCHI